MMFGVSRTTTTTAATTNAVLTKLSLLVLLGGRSYSHYLGMSIRAGSVAEHVTVITGTVGSSAFRASMIDGGGFLCVTRFLYGFCLASW